MKQYRYIFSALMMIFLLSSCEKVIDVSVRDASGKYVIEGVLTNEAGGSRVQITRTKSINDNNSFAGVQDAQVRITDEKGVVTVFEEGENGIYESNLIGTPGTRYTLQVMVNGETFTAVSRMPAPVALDSLYISNMDMMGEKNYLVNAVFTDPVGKGNAYRLVQYRNSAKAKEIYVLNDELSDGRLNTVTLYNHNSDLKQGDHIRVEMQCIEAPVYTYWYSLWQGATGEGNSAAPANPVSNISGGALGYFSAHTVDTKSILVQ